MNLIHSKQLLAERPITVEDELTDYDVFMALSSYEALDHKLENDLNMFDGILEDYGNLEILLEISKREHISEDLVDFLKPTLEYIGCEILGLKTAGALLDKIKQAAIAIWKWLSELFLKLWDLMDKYINGSSRAIKKTGKALEKYDKMLNKITNKEIAKEVLNKSEKFMDSILNADKTLTPRTQIEAYPPIATSYLNICSRLKENDFSDRRIKFFHLFSFNNVSKNLTDIGISSNDEGNLSVDKGSTSCSPSSLGFKTLGDFKRTHTLLAAKCPEIDKNAIAFKRSKINLTNDMKRVFNATIMEESQKKSPDEKAIDGLRKELKNISTNISDMIRTIRTIMRVGAMDARTIYIIINEHNKEISKFVKASVKENKKGIIGKLL